MEMLVVTDPEEMLTCGQVAELLGVTIGSINRWVLKGHFPNAWRVNPMSRSTWRIPRKDVDAFIEMRMKTRGYFYIPTKPTE